MPPSLRLPEPSAEDSQLLDGVLEKLTSLTEPNPELSANALLEVDATLLPAIRARLDVEAERSQRGAGVIDLMLAAVAVRDDLIILNDDKDFATVARLVPEVKQVRVFR